MMSDRDGVLAFGPQSNRMRPSISPLHVRTRCLDLHAFPRVLL